MDMFVVLLLSGFCVPTASLPYIYYFINQNQTWDEAKAYCIKEHTGLAQISYLVNSSAVKNTPTGGYTGKAWIGLHVGPLGWAWLNGQPATYFSWSNGQKANPVTGYCASMNYRGWYSYSCTTTKGSICFNGSSYSIHQTLMSWNDAKTNCEREHSTLVQIYDNKTNSDVTKLLLPQDSGKWIGLGVSPLWIWSETEQTTGTFMNWETGQPDNQNGDDDCAAIMVKNGTWTDEPCSAQYPFFCYGIYKSRKTVVSMNIQTDANLEDPDNSAALMQQLQAKLAKQGVTDFKLRWTKQAVKKSKTTTDLCSP